MTMTKVCNFPMAQGKRCKQPIADGRPNCGRHHCEISARQLGRHPTVHEKDGELHVWAGKPDGPYCLIHGDPAYQTLYRAAGEAPPCCLIEEIHWKDDHGHLHRDGGPAWIWVDGTQIWLQHGKLHRDDGPAVIEADGTQQWWLHDERHRDDGPAVVWPDDAQEWFWHNKHVTEEEYANLRRRSLMVLL